MGDEPKDDTPTQQTPTGYTIPVPTREQVHSDLAKVARPRRQKPSLRERLRRPKE